MGGVLAIDFGMRKTGFAIADALRIAVRPLDCVHLPGEGEELLKYVAKLLAERDIDTFLVGIPLGASGNETEQALRARTFANKLRSRFSETEVLLYDEHLTTKEAEARLREAGIRGAEAKALRDSWSAWVLLRDWLDSGEPRGAFPTPETS